MMAERSASGLPDRFVEWSQRFVALLSVASQLMLLYLGEP
jgi:hypothetical protein